MSGEEESGGGAAEAGDLLATNIGTWWSIDSLRAVSIPGAILPLPPEFLAYLHLDSVQLPNDTETSATASLARPTSLDSLSSDDEETAAGSADPPPHLIPRPENPTCSESSSEDDEAPRPTHRQIFVDKFTDFDALILNHIKRLGGSVFPKLNWKAPKDAAWIAFNKSLRSYLPGDIYLMFKSSTIITDILVEPFKGCKGSIEGLEMKYCLVLRKWMEIDPQAEFRAFVRHDKFVGLSQRDVMTGYKGLEDQRDPIIKDIHDFFRINIYKKLSISSYTFDVYRVAAGKVLLVDFNVFGHPTDPLLFTYPELDSFGEEKPGNSSDTDDFLRLIETETYGEPVFRYLTHTRAFGANCGKLGPPSAVTYLKNCANETSSSQE